MVNPSARVPHLKVGSVCSHWYKLGSYVLSTHQPSSRIKYYERYPVVVISLGGPVLLIHLPQSRIGHYAAYAVASIRLGSPISGSYWPAFRIKC